MQDVFVFGKRSPLGQTPVDKTYDRDGQGIRFLVSTGATLGDVGSRDSAVRQETCYFTVGARVPAGHWYWP